MYIISLHHKLSNLGGYNIGGINATGQVPEMGGHFALIDQDTPSTAQRIKTFTDGSMYDLVFSDEFNQDGRTFYPVSRYNSEAKLYPTHAQIIRAMTLIGRPLIYIIGWHLLFVTGVS